jgi:hypothetical protein
MQWKDAMVPITATLHTEELTSLRQLSHSFGNSMSVAPEHRAKLLGCGFAAVFSDNLAITTAGRAKLVYETTREYWFPRSEQ